MECRHVDEAATLSPELIRKVQPNSWACAVCRSQKRPWICLKCGAVHCGRYVNGHAKKHAEDHPGHSLCMDQGLTVYCYDDDEFVVNDNQTINDLRSEIQRNLRKRSSSSPSSDDTDKDDLTPPPPPKLLKLQNGYTCPVRTTGLQNLGNTCFMNSILQSLSNIEQFYIYFSKLPSLEAVEGKSSHQYLTRRSSMGDGSLVEEVRKVSCALWEVGETSLSPDSLFSVVWRLVPQFRGYQQQDAHEFMRYLLDKLHTELSTVSLYTGNNKTIVSQIFGGTLQSDVKCLVCQTNSRKLDPILDVSLDIPNKFVSRRKGERPLNCKLSDCLTSFTGVETLEETEWYYCARCKTRQPSTKRLFLYTLPNVLCLHLKRFRFNSFMRTKLSLPVEFPLSGLDMSPYTVACREGGRRHGKNAIYDLAAVVVHHGSGVSCGHYTAYAYSPKSGTWYHFNDSTVTETTAKRVASCRAYILFYVQRDTSNGKYTHNSRDHEND